MAIESLGGGFQNGYDWAIDHDETAGTIGVTVTDEGSPQAGQLMLHGEALSSDGTTVLGTINPIEIDQFDNQGRQILFTNNALKNVVIRVPLHQTPPVLVNIWTTFTPASTVVVAHAVVEASARATVGVSTQGLAALALSVGA